MAYPSHSAYAQNEVLCASPERLVQILYELGVQSIARARECHRQKDIAGRVRHINKAFAVVVELNDGLDFEAGGEIALNYARIYDYCQRRLIDANAQQSDSILEEVQSLFRDLQEAWQVVVTKVGAERTARLLSPDILPSEEALAGSLSCVG
ncbi:MAG: flagellar export chaperone FliS [Acidobacteriaceae bacterium]|nr:flagellar export chaperone FliS [Acidobacteriaceae bacterium]